jgi:hypothetical protein
MAMLERGRSKQRLQLLEVVVNKQTSAHQYHLCLSWLKALLSLNWRGKGGQNRFVLHSMKLLHNVLCDLSFQLREKLYVGNAVVSHLTSTKPFSCCP